MNMECFFLGPGLVDCKRSDSNKNYQTESGKGIAQYKLGAFSYGEVNSVSFDLCSDSYGWLENVEYVQVFLSWEEGRSISQQSVPAIISAAPGWINSNFGEDWEPVL